ncbi:STAS domain-containing protein [Tateyamaria sp.]|uniref:STAS domain-containing protein n=1 Tax=Tateyamaria sp. TaxID=1929288 RepID=UPI0032A04BF6
MNDIITLQARLDGAALKTLSTDLTRACSERSVRIDAGGVTHLGALGLQLLLSASRTLRRDGGTFEFVAISDRASDQLAKMGLTPETVSGGMI